MKKASLLLMFLLLNIASLRAEESSEPLSYREQIQRYLVDKFLYKQVEVIRSPGQGEDWHHELREFEDGEKVDLWWWLGNADDPEAPDWFMTDSPEWLRRFTWYLRNPFHNFTFYVIGVSDKVQDDDFIRYGLYPSAVMAPLEGWNWSVTQVGERSLPFLSFWQEDFLGSGRRIVFYFGWRERGNFGAKLNFKSESK